MYRHEPLSPVTFFALLVLFSALWVAGAVPVSAAEAPRELMVIEGADYFGLDYDTLEDVDLDACKAACLEDAGCRAFTYNTKARWCFLKSDYGDLRYFDGAVSGRIAEGAGDTDERMVKRAADLAFLPRGYAEEARKLAARVAGLPLSAVQGGLDRILAEAEAASRAGRVQRAAELYERALRRDAGNAALWLHLAAVNLAAKPASWEARRRLREEATAAAYNAYLRTDTVTQRAEALAVLGRTLSARAAWRPAIRALRASLALVEDTSVRRSYDDLVSEHGFRITGHRVDSDALNPRICVELSDALPRQREHLADFVRVESGRGLAVEVEEKQLCVDGVLHGERYRIRIRAGLPAADGELLAKTADLDVYVRDRSPSVRFPGRAYVLPKGSGAAIPLVSVNSHGVEVELYRVGDRGMAGLVGDGNFLKQLSSYDTGRIRDRTGEALWSGNLEVASRLNRDVTTAIPVGALIRELKPGAYVMTARPREATGGDSEPLATQWFVVSDLGLSAFTGVDGLHAMVRSLSTAEPAVGVALRLVARNDEILGRAVTDAEGYSHFDPGLLRGGGGNAPALLVAEGSDADYAFLDLTKTPFDLTDRGVDGRPAPKPIDVYLVTERGVYRPGETVHLTALSRDAAGHAVSALPLTLVVKRPDGVEHTRVLTQDQGLGGRQLAVKLLPTAMRGTWRAAIHADPGQPPLAERPFLVEDFEPERLAFDLSAPAGAIDPESPPAVGIDARFLYGAPAAGLRLEGEVLLKPTDRLAGYPGFRFGLADEEAEPVQRPFPGTTTDASGKARVVFDLPERVALTRPSEASVRVRLADAGGRPVERTLVRPVSSELVRVGIKPLFDGSVEEGASAGFEVIAVGPDGERPAREGLAWTLSKVETSFQWFELDGRWDYEPVVSRRRVASGTLDLAAGGTGLIEGKVEWGGYELRIGDAGGTILPASVRFEAGWYVAPGAVDTPDLLKISLDKPRYRVGETAAVHIEPRFPGLALVMVIDESLVSMTPVRVPEGGATVEIPVTETWGPGAYVTAALYRPMDLTAKRMPARAIGLSWAEVDPGERVLDVMLSRVANEGPREPLDIELTLANLPPGEEAYVTVAAVDLGVLNLTGYEAPSPEDWYFGQRRLGMEIRDLYGQLIDRMQGVPGVIRSGGDGMSMRLKGPPPTEESVAFHSGILRVDESGSARVSFDLPDFNGTVRVMVMGWSETGVGHSVHDVLVRDPIVISASLPRFLAPGDLSRVLIDLTHVEGPAGDVTLSLDAPAGGIGVDDRAASGTFALAEHGRARLPVPLEALAVGDHSLRIGLRTPAGRRLEKRLTVPVRSNVPSIARTSVTTLRPGGEGLVLRADILADRIAGTGSVLVSASHAGRLDVPGLLHDLDRYPYGCAEQVTSRSLPLLYLGEVADAAGLAAEEGAGSRVREAVAELLSKQSSSGGFGLWGPGAGDFWLDAYVTDFLTRAAGRGYAVRESAMRMALDNLRNRLSYASDFESGGEDVAYALYVLARNARAVIGDLRYYAEARLDAFATPLAKAQLGAALSLYGDRQRAKSAFQAALVHLERSADGDRWRPDYGSDLRDASALLSLAVEGGVGTLDLRALADRVARERERKAYTSTQEKAWLLLAAHALMQGPGGPQLTVGGEIVDGPLFRRFRASDIGEHPVAIVNRGDRPVDAMVTVTGVPRSPPPAGGNGYRIERSYYDLEGHRVQPTGVRQGERLVAVITVRAERRRAARLIVDDPLPAGFEIDNPSLVRAGDLTGIPWLGLLEQTSHKEFRADRFVAAVERKDKDRGDFQLAYLVRAVSPGTFAHPAATVEDMYRPQLRGWTGQGVVEVVGPVR